MLFTHFGVTSGITRNPWVIPVVTPKWVNNTNVHSKFTLISLFSKMHSLKSEHIHSFLFREYRFICYRFRILLLHIHPSSYTNRHSPGRCKNLHFDTVTKNTLWFLLDNSKLVYSIGNTRHIVHTIITAQWYSLCAYMY